MTTSSLRPLFALVPFVLSAFACAGADSNDATSQDDIVRRARKVSGFDFEGPKALANDKVPVEFCAAVVSEVQGACERVRGEVRRANGCRDLCSKPIAERGKAAGYDFDGYKQLANDQAPVEFCAAVVSEVQAACERVGGDVSRANSCADLCSKPIAPAGKAAGYDQTGFKILDSDRAPVEFCAAVVSPVQDACSKVGGSVSRANSCADLCSLPF
jgi:hypothetical protein